tara:strand:- start:120 stop:590 length:471 start_codon:yes stop_codon:yes gene_type:complete
MKLLREYVRSLLVEKFIDMSDTEDPKKELRPKLDAFMAEYYSMSERNPINPRMQYWYMGKVGDEDCLVLTDVNIFDGAISFNTIQTVPRNTCEKKGFASKVMKQIVALADKHQVPMTLDAVPFGQETLSTKELEAWYRRSGFDREDEYEELRREPK